MTPGVLEYVQRLIDNNIICKDGNTLEIGSYNVNGSVKPFFTGAYTGVDMRSGPDVDFVMRGNELHFLDELFDTVLILEVLEHDNRFWETLKEAHRVLKPGGVLVLTTPPNGFAKHDYPSDYWRFTDEGLRAVCEYAGFNVIVPNMYSPDWPMLHAVKDRRDDA